MNKPTFETELALLRQILENPARMSCAAIESTIAAFYAGLLKNWEEQESKRENAAKPLIETKNEAAKTNKFVRDWSKQDNSLL